jgi:hypothetical protein
VVSARAAVRRDLDDGLAIRAAAYSGFRPATLNELHRPFRVGNDLTEANAALEKMRMEGLTERERLVLEKGISNQEFHYLGSAKILGGIG